MALSKQLGSGDKKTTRSFLNQLIDVLQEDISSSVSRRKYQVFVTGGIGPGVTSSLFQTVYDQDFTLQTANPVFDVTVGLAPPEAKNDGVASIASTAQDSGGKYLYPSSSLMMREKTDLYSQFSQTLLGSRTEVFTLPVDASSTSSNTTTTEIDSAMFIAFKRLFARDQIKRETFAMKLFATASTDVGKPNLNRPTTSGSMIFTDIGSSDQKFFSIGGQYGYLVDASNTSRAVGRLYYDYGVAVLDIEKITSGSQFMSGTIDAMTATGQLVLGASGTETAGKSKLVPDFMTSGSVDNIIDHFCFTRFGSSTNTAITFQNVTNINSSLIFCRAMPDDFNFSSNPTYVEPAGTTNEGRLTIYDPALPDEVQETFAYVTTIGLYDASGGLLAVAKLSRPVEKSAGRDLTFRVRLDF
jgi:hypothetical protein